MRSNYTTAERQSRYTLEQGWFPSERMHGATWFGLKGFAIDELLALPKGELDAFVFTGRPMVAREMLANKGMEPTAQARAAAHAPARQAWLSQHEYRHIRQMVDWF